MRTRCSHWKKLTPYFLDDTGEHLFGLAFTKLTFPPLLLYTIVDERYRLEKVTIYTLNHVYVCDSGGFKMFKSSSLDNTMLCCLCGPMRSVLAGSLLKFRVPSDRSRRRTRQR